MLLSEFIHCLDRRLLDTWTFEHDSKEGNIYSRVYSLDSNFLCVKIIGSPIFSPLLENKAMALIDTNLPKLSSELNALTIRVPQSPTPFASCVFSRVSSPGDL